MRAGKVVVGVLAHVDAGKTTLAESLLYLSGKLRKLGRVDHKDAFLDTHELERNRGITIFAKQACINLGEREITLLDTPGHVDFSAEMERTLQVLDYAILIISGADGIQGHVETLWKLLYRYRIPVFLFINKMDQQGTDKEKILKQLQLQLSSNCVDFSGNKESEEFLENLALCDEDVMEDYLQEGILTTEHIQKMIVERKVFPCYFGSALKLEGMKEFMQDLEIFTLVQEYPEAFQARVFKISRDAQGNRLTHMKITGGKLRVKEVLHAAEWEEKVDQIRIYSGNTYEMYQEVCSGTVCQVVGLTKTFAGQGLGQESIEVLPILEPVMTYRLLLPEGVSTHLFLQQLQQLEEEEPLLHILYQEEIEEIHVQLMGEVQIEVLKSMILERFQVEVEFGSGGIVYKESVLEPIEGVGHFEPLRHYAEVHLLLEPLEAGRGLEFDTRCSEDILDKNWQRLILTHLKEKKHLGVLTGSEITDMKITLVSGKAHQKHTEGGDFRQAVYRAVRQGLKMGNCCLLEPVYEYKLRVPVEMAGRAMTDLQKRKGSVSQPELDGEMSVLRGTVPVATVQGYQTEVAAYTKGKGQFFCELKGYAPCHNAEDIIEKRNYDAERDLENPTGSVFCSHGAGFVVPYNEVYEYMHLPLSLKKAEKEKCHELPVSRKPQTSYNPEGGSEEELEAIFQRTYGDIKKKRQGWSRTVAHRKEAVYEGRVKSAPKKNGKEYLLVDGYNIIFAWEDLRELSKTNMEAARTKLMDILCNYQGYRKKEVIVVFDAYKVEGNAGSSQKYQNIYVVYTKEAETADQYIEKVSHEIAQRHNVTVATSDALEQMIILGQGAFRLSAKGLREEIECVCSEISNTIREKKQVGRVYLGDYMPKDEDK